MKKVITEPRTITCDCCGCTFAYESSDVIRTSKMLPSWIMGLPLDKECLVVTCPVCKYDIILKEL